MQELCSIKILKTWMLILKIVNFMSSGHYGRENITNYQNPWYIKSFLVTELFSRAELVSRDKWLKDFLVGSLTRQLMKVIDNSILGNKPIQYCKVK